MQTPDPYAVLGVAPDASQAEIVHAFRRLVRLHHPDVRSPDASQSDGSAVDLGRVLQAYARLRRGWSGTGQRTSSRATPTPGDPVRPERTLVTARARHDTLRAGPVFWQPEARHR